MNPLVLKMAPTGVVLAVGCYVMWPYLGENHDAQPAATAEVSEIPDVLLHPKLPAPPARNPFDDPEETRAQAHAAVRTRLVALQKKLEAARRQAQSTPGRKSNGRGPASGDPLAGLALNATYAGSGRDGAVINGRVFETGDNVRPENPDEPFVLSRVLHHSVILRYRGQDLELKYTATAAAPGATRASPARKGKASVKSTGPARG